MLYLIPKQIYRELMMSELSHKRDPNDLMYATIAMAVVAYTVFLEGFSVVNFSEPIFQEESGAWKITGSVLGTTINPDYPHQMRNNGFHGMSLAVQFVGCDPETDKEDIVEVLVVKSRQLYVVKIAGYSVDVGKIQKESIGGIMQFTIPSPSAIVLPASPHL